MVDFSEFLDKIVEKFGRNNESFVKIKSFIRNCRELGTIDYTEKLFIKNELTDEKIKHILKSNKSFEDVFFAFLYNKNNKSDSYDSVFVSCGSSSNDICGNSSSSCDTSSRSLCGSSSSIDSCGSTSSSYCGGGYSRGC